MLYMLSSLVFPRQAINLEGPTIPAPTGSVSILDNPPNGNHIAIPIITVCVVVSAIFYLVRFYAKYLVEEFHVSDYLTVVAFPLYWVYVYYSYRLSWTPGYLVHEWDIRLKDIAAFSYVCWLATLFYLWIIALVKCAILLEWTTIFVPNRKRSIFAWACFATCGAICCFSIIIFIMDLVNCTPFRHNWDPLTPGGFCRFSVPRASVASAVTNLVLDLVPILLAQNAIWKLHMSWEKKIGISFIFLIGITGCAAGIVRLYFATRFLSSNDATYFFSIVGLCSLCETTCANLILCVPYTPRALSGIKQTKLITGLRSYMSLNSNSNYINNSEGFGEAKEIPLLPLEKRGGQ
ncbi:hypothetical protein MFRU_007g01640 [Monilinia fructicola]|nr:hypothetical protein MFRU_007g01640 [Monilinia fructicola]